MSKLIPCIFCMCVQRLEVSKQNRKEEDVEKEEEEEEEEMEQQNY